MPASIREAVTRIADPDRLDASIHEVFNLMLACPVARAAAVPERASEAARVTAVVGFGGALSGACTLQMDGETALEIAQKLTGNELVTDVADDTVQDAIGELCNIIAGSWKGKIPELASACALSVPAVVTGRAYTLRVHKPEFELSHSYIFEEGGFQVRILCEGLR